MSSSVPEALEWVCYDPRFLDPSLPSGFWLCGQSADALTVKINAGCLAAGASWDDLGRCAGFFARFTYVLIVCPDPARREEMVREVRVRLPETVLLVARDKAFRGCATLQELRDTHGLKALDQILFDVDEVPVYGLLDLADVKQPDITALDKVLPGLGRLDGAIAGFFMGELSIWTGRRGEGKSTLLSQLLLNALDQGKAVCAYSGELADWQFRYWAALQAAGPRYVQTRRDPASGKRMPCIPAHVQGLIDAWWRGRFHLCDIGAADAHDAGRILSLFRYARRRYGACVFLVDNIMTARLVRRDHDFYRAQADFTGELKQFARDEGVHVHLVVHPRKSSGALASDDVGGLADLTNTADNVFALERDVEDASGETAGGRRCNTALTVLKNRFFGVKGRSFGLEFEPQSRRFYGAAGGKPDRRYGWEFSGGQVVLEQFDGPEDPFPREKERQ